MNNAKSGPSKLFALAAAAAAALAGGVAWAGERIAYHYDDRGRLVKVVRTDTDTNLVVTNTGYAYDRADNRTRRETKSGQ